RSGCDAGAAGVELARDPGVDRAAAAGRGEPGDGQDRGHPVAARAAPSGARELRPGAADRPVGGGAPARGVRLANAFFVRRLKPGARVWPSDPATVASPVDGIIGQFGLLAEGRMLQAKGQWYTAAELLADEAEAGRYRDGAYVTIYLSPRHYH